MIAKKVGKKIGKEERRKDKLELRENRCNMKDGILVLDMEKDRVDEGGYGDKEVE